MISYFMILISVAIFCNIKLFLRSDIFTTLSTDAVLSSHQSYTETQFNADLANYMDIPV